MSYETNDKMVSHPDHYKSGKYEVIDIIDEFTKDLSGTEAVCTANAIKYILRWKKKNGIQDVKKAIWYLTHLVEHLDDKEREDHAQFDDDRLEAMFTPGVNRDAFHMEDHTSGGGIKISDADKAYVASLGFKKIIIHHVGCIPDEVIDISELATKPIKPSIDDEPEPHTPQQASTGVYIPEEPFMNPPYDELMKQCREYYTANEHLREQFKDACDNIKLLEEDLGHMAEEVKGLKAEKKRMLDQMEKRGKQIVNMRDNNRNIVAENNRLAAQNNTLIGVIGECRSRLRNCKYTKKDIIDWLKPYSRK